MRPILFVENQQYKNKNLFEEIFLFLCACLSYAFIANNILFFAASPLNSVNNRYCQYQKNLQNFWDQTSKAKNNMKSRIIRLDNFVSEFTPQENLDQIPQELKKSSFYLNVKRLKENDKEGCGMDNQQVPKLPISDHKQVKQEVRERNNELGEQQYIQYENPYRLSKFRSELTNLKKHLQNMSEQHQQISNRVSQFRQNINTFKAQTGQSLTSKRRGCFQKQQSVKTKQKFHSKERQHKFQNPLPNQYSCQQKCSQKQKVRSKKSPESESAQMFLFGGQFYLYRVLDEQSFCSIPPSKKDNLFNDLIKQKNYLSKPTETEKIRQPHPSRENLEEIFQRIELPSLSNHKQSNSVPSSDKQGANLLKQIKAYVLKPQQMRVFKIDLVTYSFVWGWINKTDRYLCEYKDILGIIILEGNPHIWMPEKNLMKLQFSSDHLICPFYEYMNKIWD